MTRIYVLGGGACVIIAVLGLHLGLRAYGPGEVWAAVTRGGDDATALIINGSRIPRMLLALLVGAALGLSGLLMQSVTRNPIAEPGLLGVNAGAALAVVLLITLVPGVGFSAMAAAAGLGALLAAALVFGLAFSAGGQLSPIQLLLAGVTVAAMAISAMQVLVILNEAALEELLFWLSGAFVDRPISGMVPLLLLITTTILGVLALSITLDVMQTDDATAQALGVPVLRMRLCLLGLAAILAGGSVALAGPIAFVGLAAPHLARLSGASGHRDLIPASVLFGMLLAISADLLARFILYPSEAPVSAVMALIGVPLLIVLLRQNRVRVA